MCCSRGPHCSRIHSPTDVLRRTAIFVQLLLFGGQNRRFVGVLRGGFCFAQSVSENSTVEGILIEEAWILDECREGRIQGWGVSFVLGQGACDAETAEILCQLPCRLWAPRQLSATELKLQQMSLMTGRNSEGALQITTAAKFCRNLEDLPAS